MREAASLKDQMVERKISNTGAVAEDHFQAKGKQVRTLYLTEGVIEERGGLRKKYITRTTSLLTARFLTGR